VSADPHRAAHGDRGKAQPSGETGFSFETISNDCPWFYEQIFHTAADALIVADTDGRLRLANLQTERLFGYSHAELMELTIEDLIPQRFRGSHLRYRAHFAQKPASRPMGMNLALWALHRDGHEFPVEISLSPFRLAQHSLICANVRDVSELHRARESMVHARQTAALAEFGRLALSSRDVDALQSQACQLARTHLAGVRALVVRGEPKQGALALAASAGFEPAELESALAAIAEHCRTRGAVPLEAPVLLDALLLCAIPGDGNCAGLIGVSAIEGDGERNFTHDDGTFLEALANTIGSVLQRERAEERLFQSQRLEALGQLTGGVAHDFNNLLTVVSGNLQMLDERIGDPLSARLVKAALGASARGAELTRKLLAFSRRQALQPRAIDLGQLLGSLAEILRRTLGAHIDVRVVLDDPLPLVKADPGMLDTALLNLAVNARDAMPDGGRLTLQASRRTLDKHYTAGVDELMPGEYMLISVNDSGTGMPPEVLAHALEPFFTTKDSSKGSGLGLSLVYGFAKQSGGHLSIRSAPGRGTSVELYLPIASSDLLPADRVASPEMRGGSETILVVEDDEAVREVAVGFVERLGYRVLQAADARAALDALASEPGIALLFTDVVLRGEVNGDELAREAVRRYPKLKVLFTSGYAPNARPRHSGLDGRIELLGKPYRLGELARMLRQALDSERGAAAPHPEASA
jgi:PAS domain S-box-containing protein